MSLRQALLWDVGTSAYMLSEKVQSAERRDRNSEDRQRGGDSRSSDELPVIGRERRAVVIRLSIEAN